MRTQVEAEQLGRGKRIGLDDGTVRAVQQLFGPTRSASARIADGP